MVQLRAPTEEAVVKAVDDDGNLTLRFSDGFRLSAVPVSDISAAAEDVAAAAQQAGGAAQAAALREEGAPIDEDRAYDVAVAPLLPAPPADAKGDGKYAYATQYKEVGNGLFKQGQHEWALRTYVAAVQALAARRMAFSSRRR